MAYPQWPAALPQKALVDGFSRTFADARLRSQMSTGPAKMRRRTTLAPMPVAIVFRMSWAQLCRLERFWTQDTKGGVLPFTMPDQVRDGMPLLTGGALLLTGGVPVLCSAKWLVRFVDAPQDAPDGMDWRVSMSIEVMP